MASYTGAGGMTSGTIVGCPIALHPSSLRRTSKRALPQGAFYEAILNQMFFDFVWDRHL
jgi:hypothetical protein